MRGGQSILLGEICFQIYHGKKKEVLLKTVASQAHVLLEQAHGGNMLSFFEKN